MVVRWMSLGAILIASLMTSGVQAACTGVVAGRNGLLHLTGAGPEGGVSITFLGHASFLIESPGGVRIVTDYNDAIRAPVTPDIVTMNNAHPTHYSDSVESGVKYILRGWDPSGGVATHRLEYRDVRIHNVPTFGSSAGPVTTATRSSSLTLPICASPISAICITR